MFDVTNRKSYINLKKWISNIIEIDNLRGIEEQYVGSGNNKMNVKMDESW
jgi:hypothetical protein